MVGIDIFCYYLFVNVKFGVLFINLNIGISIDYELQGFYYELFIIIVCGLLIIMMVEKVNKIIEMFLVEEMEFGGVYF